MENLINRMRLSIAGLGDSGCIGDHGRKSYLEWMIATVEKETGWPVDKRVRWLGFVAGASDIAKFGKKGVSRSRMLDHNVSVLGTRIPKYDEILLRASDTVLDGLDSIVDEKGGGDIQLLICAARRCDTAARTSFCLGYVQAYMTANDLIDVEGERARTRSIFHAAYAACGYDIPASRSKEN